MNIYEGTENYIFVSYAHADSDRVMPILEALDREGFRLWYDSGIEVGSEWPANISDHIKSCYRMIFFVSEASVNSKNCRREVNLGDSLNKEILVAYLEDAKLLYGLDLQLSTNQAVFKSKCSTSELFIESISRSKLLQPCKREPAVEIAPATIEDKQSEMPAEKTEVPEKSAIGMKELEMFVRAASTKYEFYSLYIIGNLKDNKVKNAIASFANGVDRTKILVQYDNTVFGSAKEGFIMTTESIYWSAGGGSIKLADIECFKDFSSAKDAFAIKLRNGFEIKGPVIYGITKVSDIISYLNEILNYINTHSLCD